MVITHSFPDINAWLAVCNYIYGRHRLSTEHLTYHLNTNYQVKYVLNWISLKMPKPQNWNWCKRWKLHHESWWRIGFSTDLANSTVCYATGWFILSMGIYHKSVLRSLHTPLCEQEYRCFLNTLRPRQNGRHFPDDIFKCIFLNENALMSFKNSLKFVPKGRINNIPVMVQMMAWRRPGDKPLSETMMVSLQTHTCVTRPQWVNPLHHRDAI